MGAGHSSPNGATAVATAAAGGATPAPPGVDGAPNLDGIVNILLQQMLEKTVDKVVEERKRQKRATQAAAGAAPTSPPPQPAGDHVQANGGTLVSLFFYIARMPTPWHSAPMC